MKVTVFDAKGVKKEEKEIKSPIFEVAVNPVLIHEVVTIQMGNRRMDNAKTKARGEVSGGGKKPWKQKGTGRARSGSIRNPIWKGGGVTFGPTGEQNHHREVPKKKKRTALLSALAAQKENMVVLEAVNATKTKEFAKVSNLIVGDRKGLFVFEAVTEKENKVTGNLAKVKVIDYRNLNTYDVLNADKLVFVGASLAKLTEFLGAK